MLWTDFKNFCPLRLQPPVVGIPIVDHADVDGTQIQTPDQIIEFWIVLIDMSVCIDRLNPREVLEQGTLIRSRGEVFGCGRQTPPMKVFTPTQTAVVISIAPTNDRDIFNGLPASLSTPARIYISVPRDLNSLFQQA